MKLGQLVAKLPCPPMSALAEGHRIGPYWIVRLLGEGGMGAVYEARQEPLDRRVALKTLHAEHAHNQDAIARFFNEAKALSRLEHPSIVQVFDFGTAPDGTAYLVMEYLRGQSLGRRLAKGDGRLPVAEALQLAWQVADVLAVAHAQQIVHRDLKPDNLMLVADPVAPGGERVKILDFGIAKLTKEADRGSVKTHTQALMGTPMYMSPEQCAGAGGVDAKSDVYSLGCVIYEMIGGRPPFDGDGPGQLIGKHLYQQPVSLAMLTSKTPTAVVELVHRLLIKDKNQRPNMSESADAIGRLLSKLSGAGPVIRIRSSVNTTDPDSTRHLPVLNSPSTLGQSIGQQSDPTARRRRLLLVGAVVLVLVVGTATAWRGQTPGKPSLKAAATTTAAAPARMTRPAGGDAERFSEAPTTAAAPARATSVSLSTQAAPAPVATPAGAPTPLASPGPRRLPISALGLSSRPESVTPTRSPTQPATTNTDQSKQSATAHPLSARPSPKPAAVAPAKRAKLNPYDL